jgi:hypothetical protein
MTLSLVEMATIAYGQVLEMTRFAAVMEMTHLEVKKAMIPSKVEPEMM